MVLSGLTLALMKVIGVVVSPSFVVRMDPVIKFVNQSQSVVKAVGDRLRHPLAAGLSLLRKPPELILRELIVLKRHVVVRLDLAVRQLLQTAQLLFGQLLLGHLRQDFSAVHLPREHLPEILALFGGTNEYLHLEQQNPLRLQTRLKPVELDRLGPLLDGRQRVVAHDIARGTAVPEDGLPLDRDRLIAVSVQPVLVRLRVAEACAFRLVAGVLEYLHQKRPVDRLAAEERSVGVDDDALRVDVQLYEILHLCG